jgi:hypothetical protein
MLVPSNAFLHHRALPAGRHRGHGVAQRLIFQCVRLDRIEIAAVVHRPCAQEEHRR